MKAAATEAMIALFRNGPGMVGEEAAAQRLRWTKMKVESSSPRSTRMSSGAELAARPGVKAGVTVGRDGWEGSAEGVIDEGIGGADEDLGSSSVAVG